MLKKELINNECEFPDMITKENFVLWLKILKNGIHINGMDKTLSIWRETNNSLSSSINQGFITLNISIMQILIIFLE